MIILKRKSDGKEFQVTREDQERIRTMAFANGGDVAKASEDFLREKYGEAAAAEPRTVLYAGSGSPAVRKKTLHWSFRGWQVTALDVDPRCEPDVVASITDMAPVQSASVHAVQASHVLEHVHDHEVPLALAEFLRVLVPDGDLLLQVPDLQQACAAVADGRGEQPLYQSPGGPVCALDMVFGFRPYIALAPAMMHRTGFTCERLAKLLEAAGFVEVKAWVDQFDLFATAQKAP